MPPKINPCPIYMIAAPASRQGKTLFTAALARYYQRQHYRVKVFKIGPDFLDPKILTYASGQTAENLDLWMMGEHYCRACLQQARQKNDIVLVESVMGLFDHEPSNADFAQQFQLPIILIADARSMGASFAAIAYGLIHLQPELDFVGIIANRVGSQYHKALIQTKLPADIHFLGAIHTDQRMHLPERHLGLYQPQELADLHRHLNNAADIIDEYHLKIPCLTAEKTVLNRIETQIKTYTPFPTPRIRIAIAYDAAFNFIYPQNLRVLQQLNCQLVFFSPLSDKQLPPCDAVWLTGGYPELHAETLANNKTMQQSIRQHVQQDKPLYAECGGMLYLAEQLQLKNGLRYTMCGVLTGITTMQSRLQGIGMQQLGLNQHSILGHSFHHAHFDTDLAVIATAQQRTADKQGEVLYQYGSVYASFLHVWFASSLPISRTLLGLEA